MGRVHRTANKPVRCSLVRAVRTEQCEQRTGRTSEIVRTVRTANSANKRNRANSENNELCAKAKLCEQVCLRMPHDSGCERKSESQFIRQDAKRENIPSASIVCKNIKSYPPCTFHIIHVLSDHVLVLALVFYPIPDPIPRFEKKNKLSIILNLGLVLDIGKYGVKYWEKTQYLPNTKTQYQINIQYLF